jgi:alkanesulfonate monooxygenase SsuD/methylene tetrahydromethanopterin reductase-like flavin-dependent oxidoreductase (luciferase family)
VDYGNDLIFGSFITPVNTALQEIIALAQASERAGPDLVTFQDHPYHTGFLDTWTLLSYVAARTERIGLSGNEGTVWLCLSARRGARRLGP